MELRQRARELYDLGRMHDALEVAQAACERQPKDPDTWWLLGCVCRHTGMPSTSDDAFRRAVALDPERYSPPVRLAPGRFAELAELARAGMETRFELAPLPGPQALEMGVGPDARWSRSSLGLAPPPSTGAAQVDGNGELLTLYQVNHENLASSEEQLRLLLVETWLEAARTTP